MDKPSLVIPFYNEGVRILDLLDQISTSRFLFKEIISIDDGSTDGTDNLITQKFPWVKLIKISRNKGKSNAVKKGLLFATTDNVVLIDADLKNVGTLNWNEIFTNFKNNKLDMLIIIPHKDNTLDNLLLNSHIILSGTRIINRLKLLDFYKREKPKRFQLEFAINKYFIGKNYRFDVFQSNLRNILHF